MYDEEHERNYLFKKGFFRKRTKPSLSIKGLQESRLWVTEMALDEAEDRLAMKCSNRPLDRVDTYNKQRLGQMAQRDVLAPNNFLEMVVGRGMDDKGALRKIHIFRCTGQKGKLRENFFLLYGWIKANDKRRWQGRGFSMTFLLFLIVV